MTERYIKNMFSNLSSIVHGGYTPLCEIMNRYGSDKGGGHHNFTKLYHHLFQHKRNEPINILEIGIGSVNPSIPSYMVYGRNYIPGSSIRGWREYFPQATIYCCDIDTETFHHLNGLPNVHPFYIDMTSQSCIDNLLNSESSPIRNIQFDIIVDDGLHYFPVNAKLMKALLPRLKPHDSFYIIEDIIHSEYNYRDIDFASLAGRAYQYLRLENPQNTIDNNLFIVNT